MRLGIRASEVHFLQHLAPIWNALDPDERAHLDVNPALKDHAASLGLEAGTGEPPDITLVASWGDLKRARTKTPVIYMEHGAGQTYTGVTSGSYIGAHDRAGVIAVLVPGPLALASQRAVHPELPTFAIGCPRMDFHHRSIAIRPDRSTIGITWHWDCHIAPETRSAYMHYRSAMGRLAQRTTILGHTHPRADNRWQRACIRHNISYTPELANVYHHAAVLVADNTSALYEFASLGRPVIALNAPWYRRDVEHGLRFWSHVPGIQVDEPHQLASAIDQALHHDTWAARRFEIMGDVYATTAGDATTRAIQAIREITA